MSVGVCARHPDVAAAFCCDGCGRYLCGRCIEESHVLLLCTWCGEMAVSLGPGLGRPATVRQRQRMKTAGRPYSFAQALFYPFRGAGLYMLLATMGTWALIWFVRHFLFLGSIFGLLLYFGFWLMVIGLQFKIARTSAAGDTEIPDWPEYLAVKEMLMDLVTWIVIHLLQFGPLLLLLRTVDHASLLARPNLPFWIAVAFALWLGTALGVMAFGAAGSVRRLSAAAVHLHVRGFFRAGGDAVKVTNAVFVVGAVVLIARFNLEETVPYLGGALSSTVGAYWLFAEPHLSGLVFRLHPLEMEEVYEG